MGERDCINEVRKQEYGMIEKYKVLKGISTWQRGDDSAAEQTRGGQTAARMRNTRVEGAARCHSQRVPCLRRSGRSVDTRTARALRALLASSLLPRELRRVQQAARRSGGVV